MKLTIESINKRIGTEYCYETWNKLSDSSLFERYMESKSVKKNLGKLSSVIERHIHDKDIIEKILCEYTQELIPAGTKGVIKGHTFNRIIKEFLENMDIDKMKFDVVFEAPCDKSMSSEIPDWMITCKKTNRKIIGMNQIDLWSGGHQINRGYKYIVDYPHNNEDFKLLCVVCKDVVIKNSRNKVYDIFDCGFRNNTICYIGGLDGIIKSFFGLNS